jgi:hypothetical protein
MWISPPKPSISAAKSYLAQPETGILTNRIGEGNSIVISWEYHRNIMGISWEYHKNIIGMSLQYHENIMGI